MAIGLAAGRVDYASAALEGVAAAVGGGIQRFAWDKKENIGMVVTGLSVVGGILGMQFSRPGDILETISRAAFYSGAAIAGWVATEKFVFKQSPTGSLHSAQIAAMQRAQAAQMAALHAGSAERRFLGAAVPITQEEMALNI